MKKITITLILSIFTLISAIAQTYTTPNTGVTWSLQDIAANSPTTVTITDNTYTLLENLEIAPLDTVLIDEDLTLIVNNGLLITVFGNFTVNSDSVTITSSGADDRFEGFRFEQGSTIFLQNADINRGGGLRVLTENFTINNCRLTFMSSGATTSAVIQLSRGMPQITNNVIFFNDLSAIGSAANSQVSGIISGNTIEDNNKDNANRPQINLGTSIPNEILEITNNIIIGNPENEQAGGIAIANFTGGVINANISENTISGNRYGITILGGNATVTIANNLIEDNNIQNDPILGGSGINLNSTTAGNNIIVEGNEFRRNLYGITLQGAAEVNLGDGTTNLGNNIFSENQNSGQVYALFNNTPNTIQAQNNCWIEGANSTAGEVEDVISHIVDDPTLGEVIFNPFLCGVLGVDDFAAESFSFYPNPAKNEINFNNNFNFESVEIYGVQGNLISTTQISEGQQNIEISLAAGMYLVNFKNQETQVVRKLIIQ